MFPLELVGDNPSLAWQYVDPGSPQPAATSLQPPTSRGILHVCAHLHAAFSSPCKDTSRSGLGPTRRSASPLHCIHKDPVSKYDHIHRYRDEDFRISFWGTRLGQNTQNTAPLSPPPPPGPTPKSCFLPPPFLTGMIVVVDLVYSCHTCSLWSVLHSCVQNLPVTPWSFRVKTKVIAVASVCPDTHSSSSHRLCCSQAGLPAGPSDDHLAAFLLVVRFAPVLLPRS